MSETGGVVLYKSKAEARASFDVRTFNGIPRGRRWRAIDADRALLYIATLAALLESNGLRLLKAEEDSSASALDLVIEFDCAPYLAARAVLAAINTAWSTVNA